MRFDFPRIKKILSENSHCSQCKQEAGTLEIQHEVSTGKYTYSFICENGHEWEIVEHEISLVRGAYLTHTAKVSESDQEARDHFENCDWCQNEVRVDESTGRTAFAQQIGHEAVKRSQSC